MCCVYRLKAPKGGSGSESGTLRRKERSRSKSPFRSFRWRKSAKSPSLDRSGVSDDERSISGKQTSTDQKLDYSYLISLSFLHFNGSIDCLRLSMGKDDRCHDNEES